MRLRITHASGRYDVPPEKMADYLARLARHQDAHILTATECRSAKLTSAVKKKLGKRWKVARYHEYLICWRTDKAKGIWPGKTVTLCPKPYWMMGSRSRKFLIGTRILTLTGPGSEGRRLRVDVGHAPSGVDGGNGNFRAKALPGRVQSSNSGYTAWGKRIAAFAKKHPDAVQVATMDCNLDQHKTRWRSWLTTKMKARSIYAGAGTSGSKNVPSQGTHGKRLIDTAHVKENSTVNVVDRWVVTKVARPKGVDHRPITFILEV